MYCFLCSLLRRVASAHRHSTHQRRYTPTRSSTRPACLPACLCLRSVRCGDPRPRELLLEMRTTDTSVVHLASASHCYVSPFFTTGIWLHERSVFQFTRYNKLLVVFYRRATTTVCVGTGRKGLQWSLGPSKTRTGQGSVGLDFGLAVSAAIGFKDCYGFRQAGPAQILDFWNFFLVKLLLLQNLTLPPLVTSSTSGTVGDAPAIV